MRKIPTFFWEYRGQDIPDPDLATYRLCVGGAVERRLALSLEELDRRLCRIETDRRLYCVNGWSLKDLWALPAASPAPRICGRPASAVTRIRPR